MWSAGFGVGGSVMNERRGVVGAWVGQTREESIDGCEIMHGQERKVTRQCHDPATTIQVEDGSVRRCC